MKPLYNASLYRLFYSMVEAFSLIIVMQLNVLSNILIFLLLFHQVDNVLPLYIIDIQCSCNMLYFASMEHLMIINLQFFESHFPCTFSGFEQR